MKIVLTDVKTLAGDDLDFSALEALGDVVSYPLTAYEEIAERIADADAVICNKTLMNHETLKDAKNLKYIGIFATGWNNIEIPYTNDRGITVCNAGSYSTNAVAQHVFAMILNHYSRIASYGDFVAEGKWISSDTFTAPVFPTMELCGKTLGIVGFGSIGKAVSDIALAFGMKVVVYTRTPKDIPCVEFVSFDEMLFRSDIITVHCPLNKASERMFDENAFAKCKDGAYFINTARGGVISEEALVKALQSGKLSGAAVDVLDQEPMSKDCLLLNVPNLVITPHVAWTPKETRERLLAIAVDNLKAYLEGHPQNVIS
ncbi:MAG: D-2-hydroxyacid dehydrogenase [Bacillota bacterium]|nr:D-2-hydroxyacid dehydrogenase [Bacillota bacterium]